MTLLIRLTDGRMIIKVGYVGGGIAVYRLHADYYYYRPIYSNKRSKFKVKYMRLN